MKVSKLIELFRTPNGYYAFDANMDEVVKLSEDSYRYLSESIDGENHITEEPSEIKQLVADGYFAAQSGVQRVKHFYSDYIEFFLERKLSKITLQLTQNCNFRCKYCIYSEDHNNMQRKHSAKRMTWDTAKKAIDFLKLHSIDSSDVNIGLYGGEPLIEFPLIKQIVEYATEQFMGKKLTFNITTNASLLTDEIIRFFEEHDVSLMISLDGPERINDKNRVFADGRGTFSDVAASIKRVNEVAPEYAKRMSISMVMDPINDFDQINDIFSELPQIEGDNLQASIVDRDYDELDNVYAEDFIWKFEYHKFLAILSSYKRFTKKDVSPIAEQSFLSTRQKCETFGTGTKLRETDAPGGPCIPGQLRLFINVNEEMFPCERVSEESPVMRIGTLDSGFDVDATLSLLNVGNLTESACKSCWAFRYCEICAKRADNGTSSLSASKKLGFCAEVKSSIRNRIVTYLLLNEISEFYAEQMKRK